MKISKRAQKTLGLILSGKYYEAYGDKNPNTIKELVDAGLIMPMARVVVVGKYYVPTRGYTPYIPEKFADSEW